MSLEALFLAAESDDPSAEYRLGEHYRWSMVNEEAAYWFLRAAMHGHVDAQYQIALFYERGCGVEADDIQAARWYLCAANQGNPAAQNRIAEMYDLGCGVCPDETKAVMWWTKAAEQDDPDAQLHLADIYSDGWESIEPDPIQAAFWYEKAARNGSRDAQFALAKIYDEGLGLEEDPTKAAIWYRRAAERGLVAAQFALALMLEEGRAVPKDETEAAGWYRKAAEEGDPDAQVNLGLMLEEGRGGPKDESKAAEWYIRAAQQGHPIAIENLTELVASRAETVRAVQNLLSESADFRTQVDNLISETRSMKGTISSLLKENEGREQDISSATGRIFACCPLVAEWLAALTDSESILTWSKQVVTLGQSPFNEPFFDGLLRRNGHEPYQPGSEEAGVMIIGREGWDADNIQEQIEARAGMSLRIYSQEMALIALLTGIDPFSAGEDVLREMGRGHPALEHLMEDAFEWPSFGSGGDDSIYIDAETWRKQTPLTAMGYHVGVTSGLTQAKRRNILHRIFTGHLIFPADFSSTERLEWGQPGSSQRLQKIAQQIAKNIHLQGGRLGHDSTAVTQWRSDLDWLKAEYYDGKRLRFRWPDTSV